MQNRSQPQKTCLAVEPTESMAPRGPPKMAGCAARMSAVTSPFLSTLPRGRCGIAVGATFTPDGLPREPEARGSRKAHQVCKATPAMSDGNMFPEAKDLTPDSSFVSFMRRSPWFKKRTTGQPVTRPQCGKGGRHNETGRRGVPAR